jgi:hypothetical protein
LSKQEHELMRSRRSKVTEDEAEIIDQLRYVLGAWIGTHPEVDRIKIVCESDDGGLLHSLHFSRHPRGRHAELTDDKVS